MTETERLLRQPNYMELLKLKRRVKYEKDEELNIEYPVCVSYGRENLALVYDFRRGDMIDVNCSRSMAQTGDAELIIAKLLKEPYPENELQEYLEYLNTKRHGVK